MRFLEELSSRRRFGMRPGLETIRGLLEKLGNPQLRFDAVHIAGTNGKGATAAIIDSALRADDVFKGPIGRYTSPHLISINERFTVDGVQVDDERLEAAAAKIESVLSGEVTFFESLTAMAFKLFADSGVTTAVLECGLGGRLDATNVCKPKISVITRIGLDHCDWLGYSLEKVAMEKAGIIKPSVPVVLGANESAVVKVVRDFAALSGSPFYYAPDMVSDGDIPAGFSLPGRFNRENAQTALAALKVMGAGKKAAEGFLNVFWPGRFHRVGRVIIDGAHNPSAAEALAGELSGICATHGKVSLVCGFCGDKDSESVLRILSPYVRKGYAVEIANPRSLAVPEVAKRMRESGIESVEAGNLSAAIDAAKADSDAPVVVCGSLFLAAEALVETRSLKPGRFDPSENLKGFLI